MNIFENQLMKVWISTQNLSFLFKEFSENQENNNIDSVYKHWKNLKENWKANFSTNYKYISKIKTEKTERYCLNKKYFLTDLEHQFKCVINKTFEENFFNKLENCYKNYYLENKSCKNTLPSPQDISQLNNKINKFYLNISKSK